MGNCFGKKKIKPTNIDNTLKIKKTDREIKILYVEDCQMYCPLMKFILGKYSNLNIELIWKTNITEAHEYILNNKIDLIFLDRELGNGERGDDLIEKFLQEKTFDVKKIIIISSLDDLNEIQHFLNLGVFYFTKPIDINIFMSKIKGIFN